MSILVRVCTGFKITGGRSGSICNTAVIESRELRFNRDAVTAVGHNDAARNHVDQFALL